MTTVLTDLPRSPEGIYIYQSPLAIWIELTVSRESLIVHPAMCLAAAECVTSKYPPILSSRTGLFFITKIGAHLVPTIEFGVSKSAGNFRLNVYNYVYIYIYIYRLMISHATFHYCKSPWQL